VRRDHGVMLAVPDAERVLVRVERGAGL